MGKKKKTRLKHGAYLKERTAGTSNEVSFSVLDAAAGKVDETSLEKKGGGFWSVFPLFSFSKKKVASTPTKDDVLPISETRGAHASDPSGVGVPEVAFGPGGSAEGVQVGGAGAVGVAGGIGALDATGSLGSSSTLNGVGGFGMTSGAEDVAQRKKQRKKRNRLTIAFVVVLVLGLAAGAGFFVYSELSNHSDQVTSLEEALNVVISTDDVIIEMDAIVASPVDDSTAEKVAALNEKVTDAEENLKRAKRTVHQVNLLLRESVDKEAANQAIVAIEAREELLKAGAALMDADVAGKRSVDAMTEAWELILSAATLSREAAALVAKTTNENVEASREKTEAALADLEQAQTLLAEIKKTYPGIALDTYEQYVAARIKAAQHALASDAAILLQDKQTAENENEAYNKADAKAAELAANLSETPVQLVVEAYDTTTNVLRESYQQARVQAGIADSFLRDYLGTSGK